MQVNSLSRPEKARAQDHTTWGLLYKDRSSPKTDSLLANRSLTKIYSLNEDLFTNRESVFREDLFLYSSPLGGRGVVWHPNLVPLE